MHPKVPHSCITSTCPTHLLGSVAWHYTIGDCNYVQQISGEWFVCSERGKPRADALGMAVVATIEGPRGHPALLPAGKMPGHDSQLKVRFHPDALNCLDVGLDHQGGAETNNLPQLLGIEDEAEESEDNGIEDEAEESSSDRREWKN